MEGGGGRGEGDGEGGGEGELTLWGGLEGVLWRMVGQGMKNLGMEKDFERKDRLWGALSAGNWTNRYRSNSVCRICKVKQERKGNISMVNGKGFHFSVAAPDQTIVLQLKSPTQNAPPSLHTFTPT